MSATPPRSLGRRLLELVGYRGGDSVDGVRRVFLALLLMLALPVLLTYGILETATGQLRTGLVDTGVAAGSALLLVLLLATKLTRALLRAGAGLLAALCLYYVWAPAQGGYTVIWSYAYPAAAFFGLGREEGLWWCGGFLATFTFIVAVGWRMGGAAYGTGPVIHLAVGLVVSSLIAYALEALRARYYEDLMRERERLAQALVEVKELSGLLPICASCKKVRDDRGYWSQVEDYIGRRTDLRFTHSVCPECFERLYGHLVDRRQDPGEPEAPKEP